MLLSDSGRRENVSHSQPEMEPTFKQIALVAAVATIAKAARVSVAALIQEPPDLDVPLSFDEELRAAELVRKAAPAWLRQEVKAREFLRRIARRALTRAPGNCKTHTAG